MDSEQQLRRQIVQALDLEFEPAPWLRHRAVESVRRRRARPLEEEDMDTTTRRPGRVTSRTLVLVAAVLAAAVVVSLVAASHALQPRANHVAPAGSRGAYVSAVHEGWDTWLRSFNSGSTHCESAAAGMPQADLCRSDTIQMKSESQSFLDGLVWTRAPAELRARDQALQQALRDMQPLLDERVAAIDRGDLASLNDLNFQISKLEVRGVHLAVMSIDCWPKDAWVNASGDGGSVECVG